MSCLTLRTKSPPDSSSSSRISSSGSPAAQAWARARKPGSGRPGERQPGRSPRRRSARRRAASSCANRCSHVGRREPRGGGRRAAAVLVGEARREPGQRRRVEVVEQARLDALGDQQVALVEDPHQPLAPRRERPAVEVAPGLEQLQDLVEAAGQRLGAALDLALAGRRPRARSASAWRAARRCASRSGQSATGWARSRARSASAAASPACSPVDGRAAAARAPVRVDGRSRSASATSCWKPRSSGAYGTGRSTVPTTSGRSGEVVAGQADDPPPLGQHAQPDGAALAAGRPTARRARPAFLPPGRRMTSPGLQPAQRRRRPAPRRAGRGRRRRSAALGVDERAGTRRCRRARSAASVAQLGERRLAAGQAGLEPHHRLVGLELGEGQVQQVVGLVGRRSGAPGWRPCCRSAGTTSVSVKRAARRQGGDLAEGHERRPEHDGVAVGVDAPAPGPAGELGVLARGEELVALAGELGELLDHDRAGRHVDAERQRLGGEHDLAPGPATKHASTASLNGGTMPGVVGGDARLEAGEPAVVAEHRRGRRR